MSVKRVHVSVPKMENLLSFKQRRLEFLKSTTSFLRNSCNTVTCYSFSPSSFSSTICSEHLLSVNSVSTIVGLPVTVSVNVCVSTSMSDDMKKLFAKKRGILNFGFPKSEFSEFDSLQSKTGEKVSSNIGNSVTLINNLPANNLPVICNDMNKLLGNKKDISTFCSLNNASNADKLTFMKNIFIFW